MKKKSEGVRIESVKDGIKIVLENIRFEPGSDVIAAGQRVKLGHIADLLKKYPGRAIRVVGYTSGSGALEELMQLSRSRTDAVSRQLLRLGALQPCSMPPVAGHGVSEPLPASGGAKGMTGRVIDHDFRPATVALFLEQDDDRPTSFSFLPDVPS